MLDSVGPVLRLSTLDGWSVFGRVADAVTILAAVVAFFGVASSLLSRPRVSVTASVDSPGSVRIYVRHSKGSSPARNVYMGWGGLDERGSARFGDGTMPWIPNLMPGDTRYIHVFDAATHYFGGGPNEHETRLPLDLSHGLIIDVSWQRPTLPWLRVLRVIRWTKSDRAAGKIPTVLKGRAATRAYADAMKPPDDRSAQ